MRQKFKLSHIITYIYIYHQDIFLVLPGEWGLHSSPADVLPGTGLLRPVHVDPEQHWKEHAAAHWDNLSFYSVKDGGKEQRSGLRCFGATPFYIKVFDPEVFCMLDGSSAHFLMDMVLFSFLVGSLSSKALTDGLYYCRHLLWRRDPSDGDNHFEGNTITNIGMFWLIIHH